MHIKLQQSVHSRRSTMMRWKKLKLLKQKQKKLSVNLRKLKKNLLVDDSDRLNLF